MRGWEHDRVGPELGRILRFWGGAFPKMDLEPGQGSALMDSAHREVGQWRITADPESAHERVSSYVEGWKAGDIERVLGTLTEDCVVIESHGPTYLGVDRIRRWMESWFRDGGAIPRWDITWLMYAHGTATFEWAFTCTGSWGEASFDGATVVRFRGDRIAHLREYRCTEPPFDAPT